ncbi:MAG TPA: putative O-glycosylation ligase, exosortase A system-associated [Planctomycetes bacterium]|nr:putative O-glycosylation ligase, exosortase A system-associated [Planctomycetota bacterium]
MRDIIVSLIIVGLFPACFRRPFVGLCVFTWLAYMRIQDLTYGFAKDQRWSYYVAILMFAGYFLSPNRRRFFRPDWRCYLMMFLALWIGVGVLLSKGTNFIQVNAYLEFVKIIAIALFTTGMVYNRERLRILLWVIALSLGFYGVKTGIGGIVSLGAPVLVGPGGLLADNNDFSMAMAMAVPMLFQLGMVERRPELKRTFWFAVPLTVLTVGLTRSRGGFLAVSAALGVLVWRSRNRLLGILVGLFVVIAALAVAPKDYKERLQTIKHPTEEGSAASRLRAWGIATRMAVDNPFFGVGFTKFRQHYLDRDYNPRPTAYELSGKGRIVAHSSYFQMWAECGSVSLLIYLILMGSSLWTCWSVRREARRRYYSSWIINYATLFEGSMVAFMVGATFLNRAHFDLFYQWVALIVSFGAIARAEMRDEVTYPTRLGARGAIRNVRHTGFRPVGVGSGKLRPRGA